MGDSYTYKNRVGRVETDAVDIEFDGFYGKETVWEVTTDAEYRLDLEVACNVASGRFKVCLVDEDQQVVIIFENSHAGTMPVIFPTGKSRMILVGSAAKGRVQIALPAEPLPETVQVKVID